jgi:hypothetical protein
MGKSPSCDDSDGDAGIIRTSFDRSQQLSFGEYENNSDNIVTSSQTKHRPHKTADSSCDGIGKNTVTNNLNTVTAAAVPAFIRARLEARHEEAAALGLVACWSYEFGYVSIHDPTTGEWHDVAIEDAPAWAKNECFKRRELRKERGIDRLPTRDYLEAIYDAEDGPRRSSEPDPATVRAIDGRGLLYEDYVQEEED